MSGPSELRLLSAIFEIMPEFPDERAKLHGNREIPNPTTVGKSRRAWKAFRKVARSYGLEFDEEAWELRIPAPKPVQDGDPGPELLRQRFRG